MDFQKTKIYLDKLNREFARMSKDPENTTRIDVDIMASYVREIYDAILSESTVYVAPKVEPTHTRQPHQRPVVAEPQVEIAPPPPPAPVVAEIPPPAPPPPAREEPPAPAAPAPVEIPPAPAPPPPPPPVAVAPPPPPPPAPAVVAPSVVAPSPVSASAGGFDALFEEKQAKELSEKLAESAIADLKKAIALNDRLMYTSELFAGDGNSFENALAALNGFSNFEEARDYLVQYCVVRYTWTDKKRLDIAKAFIKLVRRRYK